MLPTSDAPARSSRRGSMREHRRRVAARRGRLAGRQADLALRHREAREAVHQEQHVLALVAEPLGDARRGERGAQAHERGLVGGRDDHDRAGETLGAEVVLDELAHLAAALADQREHRDRGLGAAGDHREQRRLADAGAGEDAHALPAPARHQACRARARRAGSCVVDHAAGERVRGAWSTPRDVRDVAQRRAAVDRAAEAVEHAAEQRGPDRHRGRAVGALGADRRRARRGARRAACTPRPSSCTATTSAITGPASAVDARPMRRSAGAARRSRGSARRRARRGPARAGWPLRARCSSSAAHDDDPSHASRTRSIAALDAGVDAARRSTSTMQSPGLSAGSGTIASDAAGREIGRVAEHGECRRGAGGRSRRRARVRSASARAIASRPAFVGLRELVAHEHARRSASRPPRPGPRCRRGPWLRAPRTRRGLASRGSARRGWPRSSACAAARRRCRRRSPRA